MLKRLSLFYKNKNGNFLNQKVFILPFSIIFIILLFLIITYYFYNNIYFKFLDFLGVEVFYSYFLIYSVKVLTLIIGFFAFKFFGVSILFNLLMKIFSKTNLDEYDLNTFKKIFNFILWLFYTIFAFSVLIGFSKLATSIGLIGLGLSLALQRPILNIVGWFTIVTKQIYKEGDRIEIFPQRSRKIIRGDVKEVNLFYTVIAGLYKDSESASGKTITFPNEFALFSEIRNYSKDSNYILREIYINLTIDSDYKKALNILQKTIKEMVINYSKDYLRNIRIEKKELKAEIKVLSKKSKKNDEAIDEQNKSIEKEKLKEKSQELDEEIKKIRDLRSELIPKVHLAISENGSLKLIGQYLIPYTMVKKSKTEIYINFIKQIRDEKDIEIFVLDYFNERNNFRNKNNKVYDINDEGRKHPSKLK